MRVALGQDHQQRAAGQRGPGQVQPRHKANKDQGQHAQGQDQQTAVQRVGLRGGAVDDRLTQDLSEADAQDERIE